MDPEIKFKSIRSRAGGGRYIWFLVRLNAPRAPPAGGRAGAGTAARRPPPGSSGRFPPSPQAGTGRRAGPGPREGVPAPGRGHKDLQICVLLPIVGPFRGFRPLLAAALRRATQICVARRSGPPAASAAVRRPTQPRVPPVSGAETRAGALPSADAAPADLRGTRPELPRRAKRHAWRTRPELAWARVPSQLRPAAKTRVEAHFPKGTCLLGGAKPYFFPGLRPRGYKRRGFFRLKSI